MQDTIRMMDCKQGMAYTGLGRNSFLKLANQCGAARKYGRKALYDRKILDKALDDLPEWEKLPPVCQRSAC